MRLSVQRVLWVTGFLSVGLVALASNKLSGQQVQPSQFEAEYNGRVVIKGRVVDSNGDPVYAVAVKVRQVTFVEDLSEVKRVKEWEETVDGEFQLDCEWCYSIEARFLKRGYFSVTKTWQLGRPDGTTGRQLVENDSNVVLEIKPEPVEMTPIGGSLALGRSGEKRVLKLQGRPQGAMRLGPGKSVSTIQSPCLYLEAPKGDDGAFLIRSDSLVEKPAANRKVPANVRLVFSSAKDGLVLYQPKARRERHDLVFREMREAPVTGYQHEIKFDELAASEGTLYFFCRIGGLYGKGYVGVPYFENLHKQDRITTMVQIRLNPDGTRNVTTHF